MTRVLVLGRSGQLARALADAAWPAGWSVEFAGRGDLDLTRLDLVESHLADRAPDLIVNTAGYTAVDRAETEPEAAFRLNAEAPEVVAQAARRLGAALIHLSTDYVFGGAGAAPFAEEDQPSPVNAYGGSKAEGERRVRAADPDALVARTAWLLSPDAGFVRAILVRALAGEALRVVDDQRGSPTRAADLAEALARIAEARLAGRTPGGILHVAGSEPATWFDIASAMIASACPEARVEPIASADHGAAAPRPADSRLDVSRLAAIHGLSLPPWRSWVTEMAKLGLISARSGVESRQHSGA